MIRKTSLIAWEHLHASGLLKGMQMRVAKCVYDYGPLTRSELDARLKGPNEVNPSYHKRLSELERMHVIERIGERPCSITGNLCEVWDISGRPPTKLDAGDARGPSPKEFTEAVDELATMYEKMELRGEKFSPVLIKVCQWLRKKGRSRSVLVDVREPTPTSCT